MKKNAMIFGDSYSTFKGYIPEGYAVYYSETPRPDTDVTRVEETWWYPVMAEKNLNLVLNDSWSGSTIGYTAYNNVDCSRINSFIYRLQKLIDQGFFTKQQIDTVFVFGGTNDSWADAPLGQVQLENWTREELFYVLPAIGYFLHLLRQTLPRAKIYCLVNTELKPEIVDCFRSACDAYGITAVVFEKIHKQCGHPTVQGMLDMKNALLQVMGDS